MSWQILFRGSIPSDHWTYFFFFCNLFVDHFSLGSHLKLSNDRVHQQICAVELPRVSAWRLRLQRRSGPGALPPAVPRHRPSCHYETRSIYLWRVGHGKRAVYYLMWKEMVFMLICMCKCENIWTILFLGGLACLVVAKEKYRPTIIWSR